MSNDPGAAGPLVAGVDGCPAGWVAAVGPIGGEPWIAVGPTLDWLAERYPGAKQWAVDMPIGLASDGPRACDAAARKRLGPGRASSVFPAPPLPALDAADYAKACELAEAATGKRISKQAWNIAPKIREVRRLLLDRSRLRPRVFECHPELAFARLNRGESLAEGKKKPEGFTRRVDLLVGALGSDVIERTVAQAKATRGLGVDDALDALVCWCSARCVELGESLCEPAEPPSDATGLPIVIRW